MGELLRLHKGWSWPEIEAQTVGSEHSLSIYQLSILKVIISMFLFIYTYYLRKGGC